MERTFKIPEPKDGYCDPSCEMHFTPAMIDHCRVDNAVRQEGGWAHGCIKPGPSCPVGKTVKLTLGVAG
jgi:hypothetical protein